MSAANMKKFPITDTQERTRKDRIDTKNMKGIETAARRIRYEGDEVPRTTSSTYNEFIG